MQKRHAMLTCYVDCKLVIYGFP